ncbi:MAG: type II secretion system protein [Phycisphaerales bacterium]|nr:MAG: type II secretion system protein [Phycisphaerales bacterium]
MRRKGFTLVELLVVIAIIALLMGILMPALARVRQIAFRMTCGTNLSGIGKAMLIYANDYEDELPRAGYPGSLWGGQIAQWDAPDRLTAFGVDGPATITSSFYLLVKYAEVTPKSFVCKSDSGTTEFKLNDYPNRNALCQELIDAWDFGGPPGESASTHCSYSYHQPYGLYALTTSSEPGMAVAADRNPWLNSPAATAPGDMSGFVPDIAPFNGTSEQAKVGNAIAHQNDGQNVLFLDSHVSFEKRAFCSIEDDNIYSYVMAGATTGSPLGEMPYVGAEPGCRKDSLLVHDDPAGGGAPPPSRR